MIQLGDKVRFLNENMEGIVTSIKSKTQIGVTVDSDFEIPVLASEVVKVRYEETAGNKKEITTEKPPRINNNNALGLFLAFERNGETDLHLHLHNNLSEQIFVLIYHKIQGVFHLQKTLQITRDETQLVGRLKLNEFDRWPLMEFVILPVESTAIKPAGSIVAALNFQAKTFHNYWKHCFFLEKQAYVFRLDESLEKINLTNLKQKDFNEKVNTQEIDLKARPAEIIDLHYDALQANGYGTATDITAFQMEIFAQTLDAAFVHQVKEMVYIHGIGNSWLKNKIRTFLSKHSEMVQSFEDADQLKYGNGATLVRLK